MLWPLADVRGRLGTPSRAHDRAPRDPAVQRETSRVRCQRPRWSGRFVRPDRDEARPVFGDRTGACERRAGLAAEERLHRRSSTDRDTGASRGPRGASVRPSRVGRSGHAGCRRPFDPCDTVPPLHSPRSAWRDPRRWLARIHRHRVCGDGVPSRSRARQRGARP